MRQSYKKRNQGYVLVFSLLAISVGMILIAGATNVAVAYFKNAFETVGESGALYAAESGVSMMKAYLNSGYTSTTTDHTQAQIDARAHVAEMLTHVSAETSKTAAGSKKVRKFLEGYLNYTYKATTSNGSLVDYLYRKEGTSCGYKVFVDVSDLTNVEANGILDCVVLGNYSINNKIYLKAITIRMHIDASGVVMTGNTTKNIINCNVLDYYEGIKGGSATWGTIQW